jgi:hypothetical protein
MPLDFAGDVLRQLGPLMTASVQMAIEGSSAHVGAPPAWLKRAGDVRITGWSEGDGASTILHVEAPSLGDAAEELYKQTTFWETKPAPEDTAVNVFARAAREVRSGNTESSLYDLSLLKRFSRARHLFERKLVSMDVPEANQKNPVMAQLDRDLVVKSHDLSQQTPAARQVRVVGHLDMIRHSTRTFELLLEEGKAVRGVLEDAEQLDKLRSLLGRQILVAGKAVYRASGTLLRIDAEAVDEGHAVSKLFAKVPAPIERRPSVIRFRPGEQVKRGVTGFFGKWPGEESDEELLAMLRELRG